VKVIINCLILLIIPLNVFATHIDMVEGSSDKLCVEIFNKLLSGEAGSFKEIIKSIADDGGIPNWKHGSFQAKPASSKFFNKVNAPFAKFDIDNDGKDEFVMSFFTWLSGRPGEYYRVLDNSIAMDGSLEVDWPLISSWPGLYSSSPWPYREYGLYHVNIYPFRFDGVYYLGLEDTHFGNREFMDRSFMVVKYSNKMKKNVAKWPYVTSEIDVICKFMYVE